MPGFYNKDNLSIYFQNCGLVKNSDAKLNSRLKRGKNMDPVIKRYNYVGFLMYDIFCQYTLTRVSSTIHYYRPLKKYFF